MTARKEKACSGPPKRRDAAYPHRPGPAPGREGRRTRRHTTKHERVRVLLPDEPPRFNPEAARVLLRILRKARAKAIEENRRREDRS